MRHSIHIVVLLLGALGCGNAQAGTDLTSLSRYLPYEASAVPTMGISQTGDILRGSAILVLDVNHDGRQDLVYSSPTYLAARACSNNGEVTFYQTNYPPNYCGDEEAGFSPAVKMCGDLDGDGADDLVIIGPTRDDSCWWYWIADPCTGQVKKKFTLPVGKDIRPDGKWDGIYFAVGSLNVRQGNEEVRALVMGCTVGFDKYGRGVLAVDPRDGSILWRYHTGPPPFPFNTRLADLDGDGQQEIIFVGRSPENLGDEKINGFSDDETRLFVVDRQGELLWSRHLCGSYGNGELDLGDMDGDGLPEIITSVRTTPEIWGELAIWDGQGKAVSRVNGTQQFRGVRLIQRSTSTHPSVLVTNGSKNLQEYDFQNGDLSLHRTAELPGMGYINYVGDFMPEQGIETVVTSFGGPTIILDKDFRPLYATSVRRRAWGSKAQVWQPGTGQTILFWPCVHTPALAVVRAPFAWQRLKPVAAGVAIVCLLAILWWLKRRTPRIDEHMLHEIRLNLLDNLELSNHGAIAPLKSVRRLIWHLRALQTDLGDSSRVEIRMRETWSECRESALPHLRGIIDRAHLASVGADNMGIVTEAIAVIEKQTDALARDKFEVEANSRIADQLEDAEQQADAALIRLRAEVTTFFRANVAQTVARVQNARAMDLSQAGVRFRIGEIAAAAGGAQDTTVLPPAAVGLCDSHELEFVLDNLVGNAIAAMKSSTVKDLNLTWRTADGMVLIDVTDTGCGLAEETWERALNSHYSSKPAGGEGLPNSRKYLRKYGGNLSILCSAPGKGSTFRVMLPVN